MNKTLIFSISAAFLTLVCGGCTETNQFFDSPVKPGTSVEEPEPEPEPSGELCAFPGAEGFGRNTTGGRGGKVYHVTTLADGTQSGTLRHAVSQSGARTIVFDVAGTIFLDRDLSISNGDLTIAGQTAPGQGICIAKYPVTIKADNVILRYLRFRVGNESGGEPDGLGGMENKNVIVDHCSISWSVDECCSVYGGENLTIQWCIISESLRTAGHGKGKHGYGGNWGGAGASYHHNLMAHHESRVPRLGPRPFTQEREHMDLRNNVFYNWAGNGCYGGEGMKVNIVNNYYKPGPATPKNKAVRYRIAGIGIRTTEYIETFPSFAPMLHVWGKFFVDGNVVEGSDEVTNDNWTKGIYEQIDNSKCDGLFTTVTRDTIRLDAPLETDVITTHTAEQAFNLVVAYAGCSKQRDIIDERIAKETKDGTATYIGSVTEGAANAPGLIDLPSDVMPAGQASPWPELSDGGVAADALKDTDGDGMPDVWETANGLNPNDSSDGKTSTLSKEGYTNLEVYLNSLVADITEKQNQEGDDGGDTPGLINVTPSTLKTVFDAAADGSVLLLANGEYTEAIGIPGGRAITLKAAEGAAPVLKFNNEISGKSEKDGSLVFDGLTIEPANVNYFISLSEGAYLRSLQFKNCRIETSKRGLMTISGKGVNGELIIDNCIVHPDQATGYSYIYNNGGATQKVVITHSTFYNYPQEHLFWTRNYGEALDFTFTFENNTVSRWSKGGKSSTNTFSLCKIEETAFNGTYTFRNNLINGAYPGADFTPSVLNTTSKGVLLAEKNLIAGFESYLCDNIGSKTVNDLTLGEGILSGLTTIDFPDVDNGDFSIDSNSPLAGASTTGGVIGDPRWLKGSGTGIGNKPVDEITAYVSAHTVYVEGISGNSYIEVYTYAGTMIRKHETSGTETSFDLPSGNYIVRIATKNTISIRKILVP